MNDAVTDTGITLMEQLPLPTIKDDLIFNKIDELELFIVKVNGTKLEPNPNLKKGMILTISFTFLESVALELNAEYPFERICKGDRCNHRFWVMAADDYDLIIDNTMDFYPIINYVLRAKDIIPKNNDKAIKISKERLDGYIKGEPIILQHKTEQIDGMTWQHRIVPAQSITKDGGL